MMAYLTLYNVFTQLLCIPEPKLFAPDYRHVRHGYYDPWKKSSIFIIICNHYLAFFTCEWPEPVNCCQAVPAIVH